MGLNEMAGLLVNFLIEKFVNQTSDLLAFGAVIAEWVSVSAHLNHDNNVFRESVNKRRVVKKMDGRTGGQTYFFPRRLHRFSAAGLYAFLSPLNAPFLMRLLIIGILLLY